MEFFEDQSAVIGICCRVWRQFSIKKRICSVLLDRETEIDDDSVFKRRGVPFTTARQHCPISIQQEPITLHSVNVGSICMIADNKYMYAARIDLCMYKFDNALENCFIQIWFYSREYVRIKTAKGKIIPLRALTETKRTSQRGLFHFFVVDWWVPTGLTQNLPTAYQDLYFFFRNIS